ncbi:hypothetical protein NQ318_012737 [Aromia moschata]|uniref:HTH CENPB-type domain-containing protein n=2 Tax=Aromia moschata TaxID=1265417 RepID=A0AAV8XPD4_9CUCU|nr:hypothetical protein NQ318_012737 [Aromia moschata]
MPRKYKRSVTAPSRAAWSEEQLREAIEKVSTNKISAREAHRRYGVLGKDNEKRLVAHIQRLSAAGFAPDRQTVRTLAYKFAEKLHIQHTFSAEKEMAGFAWMQSFLERHPELSVRQAEGLSLSRPRGMNRDDVRQFFNLLNQVVTEYNLLEKPSHIFNMDETGVQLINKPGKVITTKGTKDVHVLTSKESGENVSVFACCSADGRFIPPVLIFKGVNKRAEFSDGLPAGSKVYMNKKSSFINSDLFLLWLKEHFIPNKPNGKCLLVLDGHTAHSTDIDMLQVADDNDIIILCLPSHCTQALQPLDRSFFRPFKTYFNQEAQLWMKNHSNRNLTRYQAGDVIGKAWIRAACIANAINGFKACGIYPLDPNAIPDHFFSIADAVDFGRISECTESDNEEPLAPPSPRHTSVTPNFMPIEESQPSVSGTNKNSAPSETKEFTPTKLLHEVSPIPVAPIPLFKRRKQGASVLTSPLNIENLKVRIINKTTKKCRNTETLTCESRGSLKKQVGKRSKVKKAREKWSSSDEEPLSKQGRNDDNSDCECVECFELYSKTTKTVGWLQCLECKEWLHETCTMYGEKCNRCSRTAMMKMKRTATIS